MARGEHQTVSEAFGEGAVAKDHAPAPPTPQAPLTAEEVATGRRLAQIAQEQPRSMTPMGETQTGMSYRDIADNARRQLGTLEGSRERIDPKVDKYSPTSNNSDWQSPEAQAQYNNVGPGTFVVWPRIPGTFQGDMDQIADIKYRIPEAEIITRKSDGKQVTSWDVVAVAVPEKYKHMMILDEAGRYEGWAESIDQQTIHGSVTKKHHGTPRYEAAVGRAAEAAAIRSRDMGIGIQGISQTAKLEYRDALRLVPEEERLATEARERAGGRHMTYDEGRGGRNEERLDDARRGSRGGQAFGGFQGSREYNRWETTRDRQNAERSGQRGEGRR